MATLPNPEPLWTVEEYLATSWSPDREFVDGRIEERNLGEKDHSILQRYLTVLFALKRNEWQVEVFPQLRAQIASSNFRVPDVCVVRAGEHFERYLERPPFIAIEILSPRDRILEMEAKASQYARFGVENIWLIDPEQRRANRFASAGFQPVASGELTVAQTPIRIGSAEMFAELDRR